MSHCLFVQLLSPLLQVRLALWGWQIICMHRSRVGLVGIRMRAAARGSLVGFLAVVQLVRRGGAVGGLLRDFVGDAASGILFSWMDRHFG